MSKTQPTMLAIQNPYRSSGKVRHLSPDQLDIPSGDRDSSEGGGRSWEELKDAALNITNKSATGVAVRMEGGEIATGKSLTRGESHDVHALELATWKGFQESSSPITDVVVVTETKDWKPCGRCMQVLRDYSSEEEVTIQISDGEEITEYSLNALLP